MKKGWKILSTIFWGMPLALSDTRNSTLSLTFLVDTATQRFIPCNVLLSFFIHRVESVVDQVENCASKVLRKEVYFTDSAVRVGFKLRIERFVPGAQTVITYRTYSSHSALRSVSSIFPLLVRECCSMFFTIASARFPC